MISISRSDRGRVWFGLLCIYWKSNLKKYAAFFFFDDVLGERAKGQGRGRTCISPIPDAASSFFILTVRPCMLRRFTYDQPFSIPRRSVTRTAEDSITRTTACSGARSAGKPQRDSRTYNYSSRKVVLVRVSALGLDRLVIFSLYEYSYAFFFSVLA